MVAARSWWRGIGYVILVFLLAIYCLATFFDLPPTGWEQVSTGYSRKRIDTLGSET